MTKFKDAVIKVVSKIPKGKVVSYGQVALYIGAPRAARQVGWMLNRMEERIMVPWWRVINNKGRISIKGSIYSADEQRQLLMKEGIEVADDLTLDIEKYRFRPNDKFINKLELDTFYLDSIMPMIPLGKQK